MALSKDILNLNKVVSGKGVQNLSGGYGNILNTASRISTALGNIGNARNAISNSKLSQKSTAYIRDTITNGFLAQDSQYQPLFFARAFDEPTYLTFRIEFMRDPIDGKERNIAFNNAGSSDGVVSEYYSTMYDYLPEAFLQDFSIASISSDTSIGRLYSAENYLDLNLGDHGRAFMLHNFKLALRDIEENYPFYFKSISGLSELTKVTPGHGIRIGEGAVITIDCEEALDLRITQLMNMYRKIVWDDVYQRWILPDMMRYFGMRIYVSEIRVFHDMTTLKNLMGRSVMDFTDPKMLNATNNTPESKKKFKNTLKDLSILSSNYLGTKSTITRALNYATGTLQTIDDVKTSLNRMGDNVILCNNAINQTMPTLCYECHMCEFVIDDTMGHINDLKNSIEGVSSPSPQIKIKVGQVREKQAYPLNKSLRLGSGYGYSYTLKENLKRAGYKDSDFSGDELNDVQAAKDGAMLSVGQYISDEVLMKPFREEAIGKRASEYIGRLENSMGSVSGLTLSRRRLGPVFINKLDNPKMSSDDGNGNVIDYSTNKDVMAYTEFLNGPSMVKMSETAAMMNEAAYVGRKVGVSDKIVGADSVAINQDERIKKSMKELGDMMKEAADKIYGGPEIRSLATSDEMRAKIANNLFDNFIRNIEESQEEKTVEMRKFLEGYRIIQEQDNSESGVFKKEIKNWNVLNG